MNQLTQKEYKSQHDLLENGIHKLFFKKLKFDSNEKCYIYKYPQENER